MQIPQGAERIHMLIFLFFLFVLAAIVFILNPFAKQLYQKLELRRVRRQMELERLQEENRRRYYEEAAKRKRKKK